MGFTDRLAALSTEIAQARTALDIAEEQLAFQQEVAEDCRIRALVSETPLADREYRIARDDLERMRRSRDEATGHLDALRGEQDRLLELLLEESTS
jgi:predicted  nucleic acid-binding Zn-ribbon protein